MPPKRTRSSTVKTITLDIPAATDTSWYDAATPAERGEALAIGAHMYNTVRAMKASEELQALTEQKNAEIATLRESAAQAATALQAQIDAAALAATEARAAAARLLESQRAELQAAAAAEKERLAQNHMARLLEAQAEHRILQEKYDALMERRRCLEADRDSDIRVAEERTRTLLQHALDEKERAILRAEKTIQTLNESMAKQAEELHTLADLIRRKPTNVKAKGNEYEAIFREKLVAAFGLCERFELEDSARNGVGHAGDYLMKIADHTILWEVKNYDKPVPSAEVDKFRRDMKENSQVRIGVMVSRYTPIVGHTASGDRNIEFMEGKMLIYLSTFENMSEDALPNLMLLFKLMWAHDSPDAEKDESKEVAIRQIERLHADATKAKVEWRLHKSRMEDALRWMAERVEDSEHRLKNALQILQGAAVQIEIPLGIFRDVYGDDKAARDIQTILRHTHVHKDGVIVLNDLAELFAKEKSISRDTARAHIRAVLLDTAVEAPKGKSIQIRGLMLNNITHS